MIRDEIVAQGDLVGAVTAALKRKGVYSSIKAQLRAEVFHTLEDKTVVTPDKPRDVYIATELIREFMQVFKLNNSLSVLCEEMGQPPQMSVDREFLGGELGVNTVGADEKVPLLISIIQMLYRAKSETLNGANESLVVENNESDVDV